MTKANLKKLFNEMAERDDLTSYQIMNLFHVMREYLKAKKEAQNMEENEDYRSFWSESYQAWGGHLVVMMNKYAIPCSFEQIEEEEDNLC